MKFDFRGVGFFQSSNGKKWLVFLIQMTSFEFKLKMWTNQRTSHRYRPPTPAMVGTDRVVSNADSTNWPERSVPLHATWATSSPPLGGIDPSLVDTDTRGVDNGWCWNQPYIKDVHECLINCSSA
jgi:hypothetical protein